MKSKAAAAEEEDKGYVARVEVQPMFIKHASLLVCCEFYFCFWLLDFHFLIFDRALPPTFRNHVFRTGDLTSALCMKKIAIILRL